MNPDVEEERKHSQFNLEELTNLIYDGSAAVQRRRTLLKAIALEPGLREPVPVAYMSREQRVEHVAKKAPIVRKLVEAYNITDLREAKEFRRLANNNDISSVDLHCVAAVPYIQNQADDQQLEEWMPKLLKQSINCVYAQSELGHGSNLRELETKAVYDVSKQEFTLDTPSLTSTKWFVGNLGKMATHAIVFAQLFVKNVNHGVHPFIVPLRCTDTMKLFPGIIVGDIGPKFGMASNDNGFLRLTNVRIPRKNMLMRFSKVEPDGTYVAAKNDKIVYAGMTFIRALMIDTMCTGLAISCTIAVRYSAVRRQGGKNSPADLERKLIDYPTQQYRLFPELAKAYALKFTGKRICTLYFQTIKEIRNGDFSNLPLLHAISSGLKAIGSREAATGIENCRLSCGGQGYTLSSGFAELYTTTVAGCTYEGDNILMLLQTARSLLKMNIPSDNISPSSGDSEDTLRLKNILATYRKLVCRFVQSEKEKMKTLQSQGLSYEQAFEECAVNLCHCAKAYVRWFILETFIKKLDDTNDTSVRRVLTSLCELHGVHGILARHGQFMEHCGLTSSQIEALRQRLNYLLKTIRPAAVQLVDAFEFGDAELRSVLGRYDGNVYENLYKWAIESPLNKTEVLEAAEKHIIPMLQFGRSKL